MENERIAITLGDAGENHAGMEMIGVRGDTGRGFTSEDLLIIQSKLSKYETEFINLSNHIDETVDDASVLIIRNYIPSSKQNIIYNELTSFEWDTKYFDTRRQKVLNKHARSNVILVDNVSKEPDYENGSGTIIDASTLPTFYKYKNKLTKLINKTIKDKQTDYIAEGNRYYNLNKCGIGFHGDTERTKVICMSIGADDYLLRWCWFYQSRPVSKPIDVKLNSGDVYIMSEKAVGNDWKRRSIYTLRHSAGCDKYTSLKKYD